LSVAVTGRTSSHVSTDQQSTRLRALGSVTEVAHPKSRRSVDPSVAKALEGFDPDAVLPHDPAEEE
jgi:hypothetical protein